MAIKWQRVSSFGRKRTSASQGDASPDHSSASCSSPVAEKGHFIVYSSERTRFMVPLGYLNSSIFLELFAMAEEEFGLPGDGPITLPCDSSFMESVLSMLRGNVTTNAENGLLIQLFKKHHSGCPFSVGCQQLEVVTGC